MGDFSRPILASLVERLREPRRFLQVLAGPRQTGKTTLARQAIETLGVPHLYATADGALLEGLSWIETQWTLARKADEGAGKAGALLVLDEVQKISGWSETVKRFWDEDTAARRRLRVLLLGSSPLLVARGLSESLAGRFETIRVPHWSFPEMRDAFGWDVDRYVRFGGYPGSAPLVGDPERWSAYVLDSLVETTVSRDILLMTRVDKPALLRRLLDLGCAHTTQVVSYQKMVGALQDAGNTTTLAHYLDLLAGAGLLVGLEKHAANRVRQRASSPKLLVLNSALATAATGRVEPLSDPQAEGEWWGHLVETAVGAHLVNSSVGTPVEVGYWLDRNREVDFVVRRGTTTLAIEVKSGRHRTTLPGLDAFVARHPRAKRLLVGTGGVPLADFLSRPGPAWLSA